MAEPLDRQDVEAVDHVRARAKAKEVMGANSSTTRQLRSRDLPASPDVTDDPTTGPKTRWANGLPTTDAYYYDEEVPVARLIAKSSDFPPKGVDMSDAWLVKVLESDLTGKVRGARYPAVFDSKGGLRNTYTHKGRAAKSWSTARGCYVYQVAFNRFQFYVQAIAWALSLFRSHLHRFILADEMGLGRRSRNWN